MPENTSDTLIATVMEQLIAEGPQAMSQIVTVLMNLAMRMEREQFLGAAHYERAPERRGYAKHQAQADQHAGWHAQLECAQDRRDR